MQMLEHPNVLKLVDFFENHINLHLVLELCSGGEVFQQIEKQGTLTEGDAAAVMRQTFAALQHCHKQGVCHRDLKPQNLLLKAPAAHLSRAQLKIVDFGASAIYETGRSMSELIGTVSYMAPEVFQSHYTEACDVWSMGVILFQMLSGRKPFGNRRDIQLGKFSCQALLHGNISQEAIDLVRMLMVVEPRHRAGIEQALQHPWMSPKTGHRFGHNPHSRPISMEALGHIAKFNRASATERQLVKAMVDGLHLEGCTDLQKQFASLDANKDGSISADELLAATAPLGPELHARVGSILSGNDIDGDDLLSYAEFLSAAMLRALHEQDELAAGPVLSERDIAAARAVGGDANDDGALTESEVFAMGLASEAAQRHQGDWMSATQRLASPPAMSKSRSPHHSPQMTTLPRGLVLEQEVANAEAVVRDLVAECHEAQRQHRLGKMRYKLMQKQKSILESLTKVLLFMEGASPSKNQALHSRARVAFAQAKELFS